MKSRFSIFKAPMSSYYATNVDVLRVSHFSDIWSHDGRYCRNRRTMSTSYITIYLGSDGRSLKYPLSNFDTIGCFPKSTPSMGSIIADIAHLVVFIAEYPRPLLCRWCRNCVSMLRWPSLDVYCSESRTIAIVLNI